MRQPGLYGMMLTPFQSKRLPFDPSFIKNKTILPIFNILSFYYDIFYIIPFSSDDASASIMELPPVKSNSTFTIEILFPRISIFCTSYYSSCRNNSLSRHPLLQLRFLSLHIRLPVSTLFSICIAYIYTVTIPLHW